MQAGEPTIKTNVLRLLEGAQVPFRWFEYDVSDGRIDAQSIAKKIGVNPDQVFKTLVAQGPKREHFVFVVPSTAELDLKKAAKAAGQKSIAMIPQKELLPLTGYVHGGCSPIGQKKALPTWIDETAILYEYICVSGGRVGLNIAIAPEDLRSFVQADFADIASFS